MQASSFRSAWSSDAVLDTLMLRFSYEDEGYFLTAMHGILK
jgi:hypothetical protein